MRSAALPTTDDAVALGDQVGCTPEIEVRERLAEVGHKSLDVVATAARLVQRILQEHVGCRQLIDDAQIALLAPEIREPTADDGLVIALFGHDRSFPFF